MNAFGVALLWCVAQVTLVGLLAAGLYLAVRRVWAAAAVPVVLAGLAAVVVLSLLASSPWPRWVVRSVKPVKTSAGVETAVENTAVNPATVESPGAWAKSQRWPSAADVKDTSPSQSSGDDAQPAAGTVFWQTLLDELSRPKPAPQGVRWQWPATAGVFLLVAMVCGLIRLILGVAAVCRERLRSSPVDDPRLRELVDVLCAELGCRRTVEVRQCGDLATPATIGWRRPVLLVPADWTSWTDDECRAVLAHELAHVRGHDCWTLLLGQLGVALHFYHPLMHWLAGRLRLEQELAADAAAASVSGGQRAYLLTIARLALRQQDRRLPWPARTFLPTRTTFLRRIAMLRDSKLDFTRVSPTARAAVMGTILLCGVLAAGLRGPGWLTQARADEAAEPAAVASNDVAIEQIDLSMVPSSTVAMGILRPAKALARPELAPWANLIGPSEKLPKGKRIADFRQIDVIYVASPPTTTGGRLPVEILVLHSIAPFEASSMLPGATPKELDGRAMYVAPKAAALQYNERTVVLASEEAALQTYLARDLGVLPKWLPRETWNTFRGDDMVYAAHMDMVQRSINQLGKRMTHPAESAVFEALFNSTCCVVGAVASEPMRLHASVLAENAEEAKDIEETLNALRILGRNTAKRDEKAIHEGNVHPVHASPLFAFRPFLDTLRIISEGTAVGVEGSISLATIQKFAPLVVQSRVSARRIVSSNNLKQLYVAMNTYKLDHGRLPPAVLRGPDGKTPYSWRVALLPYLEGRSKAKTLWPEYHFDEPWDSPANRKVLAHMPAVFRCPTEPADSTNACYFVLTGPGTLFGGKEGAEVRTPWRKKAGDNMELGADGTILLVEAKRDIPWTKPEDIPYAADQPLPKLGGFFGEVFHVVFASGRVVALSDKVSEKDLRFLITREAGEPANAGNPVGPPAGPGMVPPGVSPLPRGVRPTEWTRDRGRRAKQPQPSPPGTGGGGPTEGMMGPPLN